MLIKKDVIAGKRCGDFGEFKCRFGDLFTGKCEMYGDLVKICAVQHV